jgi:hypothetical protein
MHPARRRLCLVHFFGSESAMVWTIAFAKPRIAKTIAFVDLVRRRESAQHQGLGGDEEDRTPDLRIANATLSQLSYVPTDEHFTEHNGRRPSGRADL